ncbi:MAG: Crp/Fnr family transcriptional regulator [Sulfitobacter sp.]
MSFLPKIGNEDLEVAFASKLHAALHRSNVRPVVFKPGSDIQHEGDAFSSVYLVKSGAAFSYALLADGHRQILFLHQPGDLAGFADFGMQRVSCSLRSVGQSVLYPIPAAAFSEPSFLTPAVTPFLFKKAAQMQSILMRTLIAVGRMEARHRIVWLILMLHDRSDPPENSAGSVEMALNQTEIGDLLGLTNVSVSKFLCQLSEEGFIERKGTQILLRKRSDLEKMIGYEPMDFPVDIHSAGKALSPSITIAKRR